MKAFPLLAALAAFAIAGNVDSETASVQLVPTAAGCVAMERKLVDGRNGRGVAMLADREKDRTTLISASNYAWYGHSKRIVDVWAKDFAEMAVHRNAACVLRKEFPVSVVNF